MRLLFIITTLMCVVFSYSLPTPTQKIVDAPSPKCADPTYSCQDLATAHSCGVVKSCIYDVWSTMSAPDDNNEICDICKEMVKEARDQLLSNMTQEEIKEVFEGSCRLLFIKPVVNACIKIVDDFIPELTEMLASRMDPNMVCTVSGLCNINKFPFVSSKASKEKGGDNLTCEFCENLVQHAKDIISSNTTKAELKTALLNACHSLGKLSDECTAFVNNNFDKIYDSVIDDMDPYTVCKVLGLCDQDTFHPLIKVFPAKQVTNKASLVKLLPANFNDEVMPLTKTTKAKLTDAIPDVKIFPAEDTTRKDKYNLYRKNNEEEFESNNIFDEKYDHPALLFKKDTECAFCKAMMFFLKNDLKDDRSEANVKRTLDSVCSRWLAGYSKYCHSFLKQNYVELEKIIVSDSDFNEICDKINICPKEEKEKGIDIKVITPKVNNFIDCEICKKIVEMIREEIQKPNSRDAIENLADKVCTILPVSFQDTCKNFIHQNIDILVNLIIQELDADSVCKELNLCSVNLKNLQTHVGVKNGMECELCKELIQMINTELEKPSVKEMVKNTLDKVCAVLPNKEASECEMFIDKYIDMIISLIEMEMDPNQICDKLGICPGIHKAVQKLKKNEPECELCKAVMKFVQEELSDESTEDDIRDALNRVCSYLPSSFSTKCQKFIDEYAEMIIALIGRGMDPNMICSSINMCSDGNFVCSTCQSLFHFIQEMLYENDTEVKIKDFIKRGCALLPKSLVGNCEAFIDEYGSSLLVLVAQELDPSIVCVELDVCSNSTKFIQFKQKSIQIKQLDSDKCTLCTTVVEYLDKLLEDDYVDKGITNMIAKVCGVVPKSVHDKCTTVIEAYGPYILQMIGQLADSKEVCQEIDMCSRVDGQVHLLGGDKCAFGPSYWCLTKAHAAACRAETYCMQNDWKE